MLGEILELSNALRFCRDEDEKAQQQQDNDMLQSKPVEPQEW